MCSLFDFVSRSCSPIRTTDRLLHLIDDKHNITIPLRCLSLYRTLTLARSQHIAQHIHSLTRAPFTQTLHSLALCDFAPCALAHSYPHANVTPTTTHAPVPPSRLAGESTGEAEESRWHGRLAPRRGARWLNGLMVPYNPAPQGQMARGSPQGSPRRPRPVARVEK